MSSKLPTWNLTMDTEEQAQDWRMNLLDELEGASPDRVKQIDELMMCDTPTAMESIDQKADEMLQLKVDLKREFSSSLCSAENKTNAAAGEQQALPTSPAADPFASFLKSLNTRDEETDQIVAHTPSSAPILSPRTGSSGGGSSTSNHRNKDVAPSVPAGWKAKWSNRRERWYYVSPAAESQWDMPSAADLEHDSTMDLLQQLRGELIPGASKADQIAAIKTELQTQAQQHSDAAADTLQAQTEIEIDDAADTLQGLALKPPSNTTTLTEAPVALTEAPVACNSPAADPFASFLKSLNTRDEETDQIVAHTPSSAPILSPRTGSSSSTSNHRNKDVAPSVPAGWKAKWSNRRERWYYVSPAAESQWDMPSAADLEHDSTMDLLQQLREEI